MKATQYMMDIRLLDAIETVKHYLELYVSNGMTDKAASCRETLDNLKVVAFDTAEIVSVTEADDPELRTMEDMEKELHREYAKNPLFARSESTNIET